MNRSFNLFPFFAAGSFFFIFFAIQILLGIFVYKDSKKRGMEPILWTLIVILVPNLIGLIVYLIVRSTYKNDQNYTQHRCKNCGAMIKKDWKVCPHCMTKIDNNNINPSNTKYSTSSTKKIDSRYQSTYKQNSRNRYDDFYDDGRKSNTSAIIVIIIIIVFIVGFFSYKFIGIGMPRFFNIFPNSNISLNIRSSESTHHINKSYSYWDGNEEKVVRIYKDGILTINYELVCKKGSLYSVIKDENNKLIYTFPQNGKGVFKRNVKKGEVYYLTFHGDKTKGSFSFDWDVK